MKFEVKHEAVSCVVHHVAPFSSTVKHEEVKHEEVKHEEVKHEPCMSYEVRHEPFSTLALCNSSIWKPPRPAPLQGISDLHLCCTLILGNMLAFFQHLKKFWTKTHHSQNHVLQQI